MKDAQAAAEKLLKHAMDNFSTDNVTVLLVRLDVAGAGAGAASSK